VSLDCNELVGNGWLNGDIMSVFIMERCREVPLYDWTDGLAPIKTDSWLHTV